MPTLDNLNTTVNSLCGLLGDINRMGVSYTNMANYLNEVGVYLVRDVHKLTDLLMPSKDLNLKTLLRVNVQIDRTATALDKNARAAVTEFGQSIKDELASYSEKELGNGGQAILKFTFPPTQRCPLYWMVDEAYVDGELTDLISPMPSIDESFKPQVSHVYAARDRFYLSHDPHAKFVEQCTPYTARLSILSSMGYKTDLLRRLPMSVIPELPDLPHGRCYAVTIGTQVIDASDNLGYRVRTIQSYQNDCITRNLSQAFCNARSIFEGMVISTENEHNDSIVICINSVPLKHTDSKVEALFKAQYHAVDGTYVKLFEM